MTPPPDKSSEIAEKFIAHWQGREGGQERANYALFLTELCDVLDLPHPEPAGADRERNDYVFERVVTRHLDDGDTIGRIDLYRKGAFVLEAKQSRWKGGDKAIAGQSDLFSAEADTTERGKPGARRAWDVLMINAKRQAEEYARALPPSHGWPPFILICDVGHCIEVYADFTGQGKNYTQFPDRQTFRVYLEEPSARKPSFPADPVAQTAAVFAVLAGARGPTTADALAAYFRKTKTVEKTIFGVLESLARLGHVTTKDGKTFEIRRVA